MKTKADTDDGWFKVANDIVQAIARADLTGTQYAVCLWVLCRTYGVKVRRGKEINARKATEWSAHSISRDLGRDHKVVGRAVADLVEWRVLSGEKKSIGLNTRVGEWAPLFSGAKPKPRGREIKMGLSTYGSTDPGSTDPGVCRPVGTGSADPGGRGLQTQGVGVYRPNPRSDENVVRARANDGDVERWREERTATAPSKPPNGQNDTAEDRAMAGRLDAPPSGAPDWTRLPFGKQQELGDAWDGLCESNARDRRAAREIAAVERDKESMKGIDPKKSERMRKAAMAELRRRLRR